METARVSVTEDRLGSVSPFVFGALTEHFGRTMYGGIWDLERDIPRQDVQAAVRALGTTMFRYPGGCFSAGYHWRDGVGPKAQRPRHEQTYWSTQGHQIAAIMAHADLDHPDDVDPVELGRRMGPPEPNAVGTDEFLRYCVDMDAEPFLIANLGGGEPAGTGTPEEAADWVRYCNVDRRSPRPVEWWGVGNETWGPHEPGHCSADEYARRLLGFVEAMKGVDPSVKIVATGAYLLPDSGLLGGGEVPPLMPPGWDETLLSSAGAAIDALSLHWYFPAMLGRPLRDDEADSLQVVTSTDHLGEGLDATIALIDRYAPAGHEISISLDEWNQMTTWKDLLSTNHRLVDGVFVAGCYNRMFERADRVRIAMVSHLVNSLAPIQTEGDRMFVTAEYLVGLLYRWMSRRQAVRVEVECGRLQVPPFAMPGDAEGIVGKEEREAAAFDAAATADAGGVTVFLANRHLDRSVEAEVTGLPAGRSGRFRYVTGDGPFARNTIDRPDALGFADARVETRPDGSCRVTVAPHTAGALAFAI